MSNASTHHMIEMYMDEAALPLFLSSFFQSPPRNFHVSEQVEVDIRRDDENIAIVVQDLKAGARDNTATVYTNKAFTPPIFKERGTITAYDMIKRRAGHHTFEQVNFAANAMEETFTLTRKLEAKIRRSIELMAGQVLQDGAVTLTDETGVALYQLDFQAKATHKATTGTTWSLDGSTGHRIADLTALAAIVRRDGKRNPTKLIFGTNALQRFLAGKDVQAALDKNVLNLGALEPEARGEGATFYGFVWLGNYRLEVWVYDGYYRDPETDDLVNYVDPDNVIMLSDGARLDLSYGAIPWVAPPDPQIAAFLPPRMSDSGLGLDLTLNAWITENREHLKVQVGTRPLTIPTALDTFARLRVVNP